MTTDPWSSGIPAEFLATIDPTKRDTPGPVDDPAELRHRLKELRAARIRAFVKACTMRDSSTRQPPLLHVDGAPLHLADLEALLDDGAPVDTRTTGPTRQAAGTPDPELCVLGAYLAITLAPIAVALVLVRALDLRGRLAQVLVAVTTVTAVGTAVARTSRARS